MTQESKGLLTLLIYEIQRCDSLDKINQLLKTWIDANDLHPEKVEVINNVAIYKQ